MWSAAPPVRFVSRSDCMPTATAYGADVIAQLAAQQDRLIRTVQALESDLATIRWQQFRPAGRPAPLAAPSKQPPLPETYASPQASPQAVVPFDVPPPPVRKSPPLPPTSMPPQAREDASLQWQRALQAHRVKLRRETDTRPFAPSTEPDRAPFPLD